MSFDVSDASVEVCETRDVKGLYKAPENPELRTHTGVGTLDMCVRQVIQVIENRGIYPLQHDLPVKTAMEQGDE
jgi:adenylylsulfate kinase-like enzyme